MKHTEVEVIIAAIDANEREFLADAVWAINHSFRITQMTEGEECLKYLKEKPAAKVLFLDLAIPNECGFECLKAIKELCTQNKMQLIIYAVSSDYQVIQECYRLGADAYIVKPHTFSSLLNILSQVFTAAFAKSKSLTKAKDGFVIRETKPDDEWYQVEYLADVY